MSGTNSIATAYVQILPTTKGLNSSLTSALSGAGESAGSAAGSKIGAYIKSAIAAAGIGTVLKNAIVNGMELEQNLGGTEVVFGEFAQTIQDQATEAYRNMGTSASEYMATANKMASLFQGAGLEQQESLDLTSQAMQRATDVASVMGLDTAMALESIAGAAKGNFTMMDNLGVAMNATTLQAYALEKGINFDWNTASNAEKSRLAMQMFFERTEQYAGNFARESEETLSGSMDAMKAAFANTLGDLTLGNDIEPSLEALKSTVLVFAEDNLLPALVNIIGTLPSGALDVITDLAPELTDAALDALLSVAGSLGESVPELMPVIADAVLQIAEMLTDPETLVALVEASLGIMTALATGMIDAIPALLDVIPDILLALGTALVQSIPLLLVSIAEIVTSLISAFVEAFQDGTLEQAVAVPISEVFTLAWDKVCEVWDLVCDYFDAMWEEIAAVFVAWWPEVSGAFSQAWDSITAIWDSVVGYFQGVWDGIVNIYDDVKTTLKTFFSEAWESVKGVFEGWNEFFAGLWDSLLGVFGSAWNTFYGIGADIVQGVWAGISGLWSWFWGKVSGFFSSIVNGVKSSLGIASPSKVFAQIGGFTMQGLAQGIERNTEPVSKAIADVTKMTTSAFDGNLAVDAAIGISGAATGNGMMEQLLNEVIALREKLDRIQIYLSTGALVGGLVDEMDRALAERSVYAERGVMA